MKKLPSSVEFYRRTPEFTEDTVPAGLTKSHRTKSKVWGKIVVKEGKLRYRILKSIDANEVILLNSELAGIIEPEVEHDVLPLGNVLFYVEFYR